MGRKHKKDVSNPIGQFDGNVTNDDEVYMKTEEYWKTGLVDGWVPNYRDWLDLIGFRVAANTIIDESDLDKEEKKKESDVLRRCKVSWTEP